jgi:hypothetical protein
VVNRAAIVRIPPDAPWCPDETPTHIARSANDNSKNPPAGSGLHATSIVLRQGQVVGQVAASDADEAIEAAAADLRTDIKMLIAVRRWAVAS